MRREMCTGLMSFVYQHAVCISKESSVSVNIARDSKMQFLVSLPSWYRFIGNFVFVWHNRIRTKIYSKKKKKHSVIEIYERWHICFQITRWRWAYIQYIFIDWNSFIFSVLKASLVFTFVLCVFNGMNNFIAPSWFPSRFQKKYVDRMLC